MGYLKDILTLKSLSQYGSMLDSYDLDQLKKLADDNKLEEQLKNLGMIKPYHRKRLLRAVKNNLHDPVVLLKQEIEDLKIKFMFLKEQIEGFKSSGDENRYRWMHWIREQTGNTKMWLAVNNGVVEGGGKRRRKSLKRKPSLKKSKRKKTKRKKTKRKKTKSRRN